MTKRTRHHLVEFSGEHPTLPMEELGAAALAEGETFKILERYGRLCILETNDLTHSFSRSAMVRNLSLECAPRLKYPTNPNPLNEQGLTDRGSVKSDFLEQDLTERGSEINDFILRYFPEAKTFRIIIRKLGGRYRTIDGMELINRLAKSITLEASLHSPDVDVLVYLTPSLFFGIRLMENNRKDIRKRAVRYRPFFSPISLHPMLARTLVNLARVPPGGTILDPFCGTGGILLEASSIGLNVIGSDRDNRMLEGGGTNLECFGEEATLIRSDIGDIHGKLKELGISKVDGIATDLPYGRASTTFGEDVDSLRDRAMDSFGKVLRSGGYAAVVSSDNALIADNKGALKPISCHRFKIHATLDRFFMVFRKERKVH